ncbi:MAG TPA: hypothetical protein VFM07_05745, partial [Intrasporangium sp.]|nr:hypothetical protein [Intrasporangium sp.]
MTAGCTLAVGGVGFALAGALPAQAASDNNTKVWVCKYVGAPGNERYSHVTDVAWNTIAKDFNDVTIGSSFGDNQQRSYVIQIGGPQPSDAQCLAGPEPTTTTTQPTDDRTTTEPPVTTTTEPPVTTTTEPPVTTTTEPPVTTTTEPPVTTTTEPPVTTTTEP